MSKEIEILLRNRFKILGFLGEGDFGYVWRSQYSASGKVCAIKQKKFIDEDLGDVDTLFKRQCEAKIKHPNVIEIFEMISADPESFLVMEYCDKGSLEKIINNMRRDRDRFAENDAVNIIEQVCLGLQAIHEAGYYHRDINPKNILLSGERVLIGDLGLIKKSYEKSSNIKGSTQYIPLEQQVIDKRTNLFNADARSDLFAVGVIFYEMLNGGKRPFRQARDDPELRKLKSDLNYINSLSINGVGERLLNVIRKCLQPNPDDRYQTAQEMIDDLKGSPVSSHISHIASIHQEISNYLKRKNKYGTSAPQDVLTIINRRRNIQTYVQECGLLDSPHIQEKLQEIDNMIFQQRKADYKIMWTLARPDRKDLAKVRRDLMRQSKCATWEKYLKKNKEKIDLYSLLCEQEYWDFNECGVDPNNSKNEKFFQEDWQWFIDNLFFEKNEMKSSDSILLAVKLTREEAKTESVSEKIKLLKKAVRLSPHNSDAHSKLSAIYIEVRKFDEALKHAKKAVEIRPTADAYNILGIVHYWRKERDKEIKCYEEAIKLNPHYSVGYSNLGLCYSEKNNIDKAIELWKKALEIYPGASYAHHHLSRTYRTKGQLDKAIEHGKKAIENNPTYEFAYENLSDCYKAKGIPQEAEKYRKKADELKEKEKDKKKKYHEIGISLGERLKKLKV